METGRRCVCFCIAPNSSAYHPEDDAALARQLRPPLRVFLFFFFFFRKRKGVKDLVRRRANLIYLWIPPAFLPHNSALYFYFIFCRVWKVIAAFEKIQHWANACLFSLLACVLVSSGLVARRDVRSFRNELCSHVPTCSVVLRLSAMVIRQSWHKGVSKSHVTKCEP